jgi:hypothetical protein
VVSAALSAAASSESSLPDDNHAHGHGSRVTELPRLRMFRFAARIAGAVCGSAAVSSVERSLMAPLSPTPPPPPPPSSSAAAARRRRAAAAAAAVGPPRWSPAAGTRSRTTRRRSTGGEKSD